MTRTASQVRVRTLPPELVIRGDRVEAALRPELGAKVTELLFGDRQRDWLWHNDRLPHRKGRPGASYERDFDSGGWDELFPTVAETAPFDVGGAWEGLALTDHGELWCRSWTVPSHGLSHCHAVCEQRSPGFRFSRMLNASQTSPVLRSTYEFTNNSALPMPFVWAAHPIFALRAGMSLEIDPDAPIIAESVRGQRPTNGSTPRRWNDLTKFCPSLESGRPFTADSLRSGVSAKIFVRNEQGSTIGLRDGETGELLRIGSDDGLIPYIAIWINLGAWSGDGGEPLTNVGIEPTSSAHEAPLKGTNGTPAKVAEPGEELSWSFEIRYER